MDAYNIWKFHKNCANKGQIYDENSKFWQFWGLYSRISAPINVKFGTGEPTKISHLAG